MNYKENMEMGVIHMTNKEKLKKVINQDINKNDNYDAILKLATQSKKIKYWQYAIISTCLIIAFIGVILLNNHKMANNEIPQDHVNSIEEPILNINNIDMMTSSIEGDFVNYDDIDIEKKDNVYIPYPFMGGVSIPENLKESKSYVAYYKDDKAISNYVIEYGNEYRNIIVAYQKANPDYYDLTDTDIKTTIINDYEVQIFKLSSNYFAIFTYNDYDFKINTSNITEEELKEFLVSILI